VARALGAAARFDLVFHGGSGSALEEIHETLEYGVIKMNIDTDTQYAYTRPIADHMLKNYDGVLKRRRRGRQQEALRPARLPEGGREGHAGADRPGLP
jgi:fructose/tagatose bisphosphate aldolase